MPPTLFISIVKQINSNPDSLPIVFHYEERRPDTNHNRTLKFPAHYSVCARNTNQLTRRTFNKCKLCANLVELSGAPGSIFISSTPLLTNSKNNPGVNLRGIGNGGLTVSTISLSFLLLYLFFFHTVSHLCPPLLPPPSFPFSPLSLFSSCCVILILHTLLLRTMNNAWCVRNPQSHAWLPASITELASLLRR